MERSVNGLLGIALTALLILAAFALVSALGCRNAYANTAQAKCGEYEIQGSSNMAFSKIPKKIKAGKTYRFKASSVIDGMPATSWSVSNRKIASISNNGTFKAKRYGTVRVTARCGDQTATMKVKVKPKKVVALDPGHSSRVIGGMELNSPYSRTLKAKDNSGTAGRYTHVPEYVVTMKVSNKIKTILESKGYKVVMTRHDNKKAISCIGRAMVANRAKADIFVRIHCDGSNSSAVNGISMQAPGKRSGWATRNYSRSARLSRCILNSTCKATGARSKGTYFRNDLTGNSWAKMPVTLIEMGFMSNPVEDRKLVTNSYQNRLARGISKGIDMYFGYRR